jgi:hypothetical protein
MPLLACKKYFGPPSLVSFERDKKGLFFLQ